MCLPCRRGDYLLWITPKSMMHLLRGGGQDAWQMADFWEMRDGDFVTLTNRRSDLPSWFQLHPTEVAGREVPRMMARLKSGWEPGEITDGPNIWRVKAGDRLAWVGPSRPDAPTVEGTLKIIEVRASLLAIGESHADPTEGRHVPAGSLPEGVSPSELAIADALGFGSASKPSPSSDDTRRCHQALQFMWDLGVPDSFAEYWRFG